MADISDMMAVYSVSPGGVQTKTLASGVTEFPAHTHRVILTTIAADATFAASEGGTEFLIPQNGVVVLDSEDLGGKSIWFQSAAGAIRVVVMFHPLPTG